MRESGELAARDQRPVLCSTISLVFMEFFRNFFRDASKYVTSSTSDESFLHFLKAVETIVAKVLSLVMVMVLFYSMIDLCWFLVKELFFKQPYFFTEPYGAFSRSLIEIFGLFLNILIALEVLENITAYLKKHVIQLELVIVTSLTAVARKIIIFDSKGATGVELMGLGIAVIALAISYWIVRRTNRRYDPDGPGH